MFNFFQEKSIEINAPIEKVWDLNTNPEIWPQVIEEYESCELIGKLKAGSKILIKVRNRSKTTKSFITEVSYLNRIKFLIKDMFRSEFTSSFKKISLDRTLFTQSIDVSGFLVPFFRNTLENRLEEYQLKLLRAFKNLAEEN